MPGRRPRISSEKIEGLIACFVAGMPARHAARAVGVNRNTAQLHFQRLRETIAGRLQARARRSGAPDAAAHDRNDRFVVAPTIGALRGNVRFGVLEREQRIHFVCLDAWQHPPPAAGPDHDASAQPQPHCVDAVVCEDTMVARTGSAAASRRRLRLVLCAHLDAPRRRSVKTLWNKTMRHLRRFNGVSPDHLYLYLKECEWRLSGDGDERLALTLKSWLTSSA